MKNHNRGLSGPDWHLDIIISKIYDQLKAKIVFVEISYSPHIHGMKTIAEMINFDWGNFQKMRGVIYHHISYEQYVYL